MTKKQMKRFCVSAVVFALLLALGGCNKLPQNPTPPPPADKQHQSNQQQQQPQQSTPSQQQPNKQIKIEFDADKIEVKQQGRQSALLSGTTVIEGTKIEIKAKNLPAGQTVDKWTIGKKTQEARSENRCPYTVRDSDAENGTINISYTTKNAQKLTLSFDGTKMTVEIREQGQWQSISSSEQVAEGTEIRIEAKNLSAGQTVDKWTIGKNTRDARDGNRCSYTLHGGDTENNTITVSYTVRNIVNLTINFDAVKVSVQAQEMGAWKTVTSGSTVQENTQLRLTAIDLPAETTVQSWKIGNTPVAVNGHELIHTVRKVNADANNTVVITYSTKSSKKLTVTFDSTKVRIFANGIITSGTEVADGTRLYIATQNLPSGKQVDTWIIGKQRLAAHSNGCEYSVNADDADASYTISVSYTTKPAQMFTITFDETKMHVFYSNGPSITSGTKVAEHILLAIDAVNLPAGKKVAAWKIGNKTIPATRNGYTYNIEPEDAGNEQTITISYTETTAEILTLNFDSSKMEVRRSDNWQLLSNGTKITEETQILIEAQNLLAGQTVETWQIGKNTREARNGNREWYTVHGSDAENGTIHISYTTKPE